MFVKSLVWYLNQWVLHLARCFLYPSFPSKWPSTFHPWTGWLFPLDQYVLRMDARWMAQPPSIRGSVLTVAEAVHQSGTAKARGAASARVNSPHWRLPGHRTSQNSRNDDQHWSITRWSGMAHHGSSPSCSLQSIRLGSTLVGGYTRRGPEVVLECFGVGCL